MKKKILGILMVLPMVGCFLFFGIKMLGVVKFILVTVGALGVVSLAGFGISLFINEEL